MSTPMLKVIIRYEAGDADVALVPSFMTGAEALIYASRLAKMYSETSGVLSAAVIDFDTLDLITRFIGGEVECDCGHESGDYPCEAGMAGEGCGS